MRNPLLHRESRAAARDYGGMAADYDEGPCGRAGSRFLTVPHRERGEPSASALAKPFPDLIWHLFGQAEARAAIEGAGLRAGSGRLVCGWTVTPGRRLVRYALWTATRRAGPLDETTFPL